MCVGGGLCVWKGAGHLSCCGASEAEMVERLGGRKRDWPFLIASICG